jgi:hypothetical protein
VLAATGFALFLKMTAVKAARVTTSDTAHHNRFASSSQSTMECSRLTVRILLFGSQAMCLVIAVGDDERGGSEQKQTRPQRNL